MEQSSGKMEQDGREGIWECYGMGTAEEIDNRIQAAARENNKKLRRKFRVVITACAPLLGLI